MVININALQHQAAVTPTKTDNNDPVDLPVVSFEVEKASKASKDSTVAQEKKPEYSEDDLQHAVTKLNNFVQTINKSLQFSVDKESGIMITKVVDSETKKVIWQMPTEDTIKLARSLTSEMNPKTINIFSSKA